MSSPFAITRMLSTLWQFPFKFWPQRKERPEHLMSFNPFLDLPVEILLIIAEHLDPESQVLLSLSCKRLRELLSVSTINLKLPNLATRVSFLQHLERDRPEYLTCRQCGWMFLWQRYRRNSYGCPRGYEYQTQHSRPFFVCWDHFVLVRREVVDLLSRGPSTGLPLSWLNSQGHNWRRIPCTTEARWVDGQILLSLHWRLIFPSRLDVMNGSDILLTATCLHQWYDWKRHSRRILNAVESGTDIHDPQQKCVYCDTDSRTQVQVLPDGCVAVDLRAWQNLGSRDLQTQATEQYHCTLPRTDLGDAVSNRDLESLFARGQGDDSGSGVITNCLAHVSKDCKQ